MYIFAINFAAVTKIGKGFVSPEFTLFYLDMAVFYSNNEHQDGMISEDIWEFSLQYMRIGNNNTVWINDNASTRLMVAFHLLSFDDLIKRNNLNDGIFFRLHICRI